MSGLNNFLESQMSLHPQANGYSVKASLCQFASWHGTRAKPDSIYQIQYDAHKTSPTQTYTAIELRSFSMSQTIPNFCDWAQFNSLTNNILKWTDNGNNYQFIIPESLYDGCTLKTILTLGMDQAYGAAVYCVDFDPTGSIFVFTTHSGGTLSFTPDATWPWLQLGFILGQTVTSTAGTITSTCIAHLEGSSHIFLSIPQIQTANSILYNSSSITYAIPVSVASTFINQGSFLTTPMGVRYYTNPSKQTLTNFTIYIYFEFAGNLYPLIMDANSSYSMSLLFLDYGLGGAYTGTQ